MNRKIYFRAKTEEGEWVYGGYVICLDEDDHRELHLIIPPYIGMYRFDFSGGYYVLPETVGQFTGLTDKNGMKIFEGDIVRNVLYREMPFIVKYNQSRGGYFPFASGDGCGCCEIETITPNENGQVDVEVIGNIHDNPELL